MFEPSVAQRRIYVPPLKILPGWYVGHLRRGLLRFTQGAYQPGAQPLVFAVCNLPFPLGVDVPRLEVQVFVIGKLLRTS